MTNQQTAPTGTDATASTLDRRRDKMQTTKSAAEAAASQVDALDQQLAANAEQHSGHEADLQATLDRVAALKKSVKAATKERERLRSERRTARRDAARSQDRARRAEAKYDTAVLADMLRREKDTDLSAHTEQGAPSQPNTAADANAGSRPARTTATRTAARTTAARAGTGTGGRRAPASRTRSAATAPPDSSDVADPRPDNATADAKRDA